MSANNFRLHFWLFQIDTQLFFLKVFEKIAILDGTTMSIIELVRDIWMSNACVKFEERSLNPSILDVRNSLSMAFLAISDPYGT